MPLPAPIETHAEAVGPPDGTAPTGAFAMSAVVEDAGGIYRGREVIEAWWRATKRRSDRPGGPARITRAGGLRIDAVAGRGIGV